MRIALPALLVLPALLLPALPAAAQAPNTPPAAVPGVINPQPMVPLMGRRLFSPSGEELAACRSGITDHSVCTSID